MIADWETDRVYISFLSTYDFKEELKELKNILRENNTPFGCIAGSKDYFCRDYMPIQVDKNSFVQFLFKPDYLLNKPDRIYFVTNTESIIKKNEFYGKLGVINSDIILEGGNIVKSKSKVIITDKVIHDNPNTPLVITKKLENLLNAKVIIIPRYPKEETGHADGLVRFIDENTVLTINLQNESKDWVTKLRRKLKEGGLQIESLPNAYDSDKDWRYINYLQVNGLLIVPIFDCKSDEIMLPFFNDLFGQYGITIRQLDANGIAKNGGVLNCFTWNILN